MSDAILTPVQNGCHEIKGPHEVPITAAAAPAAPQVDKNTLINSPADLSANKKETANNINAQTAATTTSQSTSETPHPEPGKSSGATPVSQSQVPADCVSSDSKKSDVTKTETVVKSNVSDTVPEAAQKSVEETKSKSSSDKKGKKEEKAAKSSNDKSSLKPESRSKKSRDESAIEKKEAKTETKVLNGDKKKGRKRKESETSEDTDHEPRTGKRVRLPHQPFQHPSAQQVPQYYRNAIASQKLASRDSADDKIVVFTRGEFLAVRNDSDSFYVCRTTQNVYKTSRKFKIQWLQNEKNKDIYQLDFLDQTDFECVLTNLRLNRRAKGEYELPSDEKQRILNILQRAINVERGVTDVPDLKQVAADGIDVSIVGKKEEKELLELEAQTKRESPPVVTTKPKASKPEKTSKPTSRPRKPSTESTRSSRSKSDVSKDVTNKPEKVSPVSKKDVKSEKKRRRDSSSSEKVVVETKKPREKKSTSSPGSAGGGKSKDQVLVEKIVDEIVKKHKIKSEGEKEMKKKKKSKDSTHKDIKSETEVTSRSSRLTRNTTTTASSAPAPPAPSPPHPKPQSHHETIRGLVNLLNSFSSSSLRYSTLLLLERLATDYPKDCLPFIVETLLSGHRNFHENDDNCEYYFVVEYRIFG